MNVRSAAICLALALVNWPRLLSAEAPIPTNTETIPAAQAAGKMTLPEGFRAQLFAGEPDVVQPIAMTIDDRGRLWVAECLSYPKWDAKGADRISILEDTDGDGRFDKKKVFWDQGNYLTGLQLGFGGVWACCAPHLLFIPDADDDDVPDGPPVSQLDGWSTAGKHNVVNALRFGPDGWLYGCNGITAPSMVGRPGAKEKDRQAMSCGVWRFHPTRKMFEIVAHGTTNPWGLDFDKHGELFITNCVIAHLWHVTPGGRYKRMFGVDNNPHAFDLLDTCADHLHWGGGHWTGSRTGAAHSEAGGGHAHAGAMIYQADNWPKKYRDRIFIGNIHGFRVNSDRFEQRGSGYAARHEPDFLLANDSWFRALDLHYGPDGGVYLNDWNDTGECHDYDDVKRGTGRIFKITYGNTTPVVGLDLAKQSDDELVRLHTHKNEWYVRHARRLLHERSVAGKPLKEAKASLRAMLADSKDESIQLRALWTLYCIGGAGHELLTGLLNSQSADLRSWGVRLLSEDLTSDKDHAAATMTRFVTLAEKEPSPRVRLTLASILQRIDPSHRWPLATALAAHVEDAADANIPLMLWYGIELAVADNPSAALDFVRTCQIPSVRRFVARRVTLN